MIKFKLLSSDTWKDFETLFGENGACAGCWCMYWIMRRKEYDEKRKDGRTKSEMKKIVKTGTVPGLIAYDGNTPAGWIAIQPREKYPVLANSKILSPVDDKPAWSITCFFVHKNFRRKGLSVQLINEAVKFAKKTKQKLLKDILLKQKMTNRYLHLSGQEQLQHLFKQDLQKLNEDRQRGRL